MDPAIRAMFDRLDVEQRQREHREWLRSRIGTRRTELRAYNELMDARPGNFLA